MDREELEKIRRLSDNAVSEIERLQGEISRYKSGADSFEEGVLAIKNLAEVQKRTAEELRGVIYKIPELDTKKIRAEERKTRERLNEVSEEIREFNEKAGEILEKIEAQNRLMRKEIRKAKEEILEEFKGKTRKGFRLFGKK